MDASATDFPFKCSHCDEAFRFQLHLKWHVKVNHPNDADADGAVENIAAIENVIAVKAVVNSDESEIEERRNIRKNLPPHPDYPFRCSVCFAFFSEEGNLKSHFDTLHVNRGQDQDDEQTTSQDLVQGQADVNVTTTERTQNSRRRVKNKLPCPYCTKSFVGVQSRAAHIKHTHFGYGIRCPVPDCGRLEKNLSQLKQHMIKHSNERPFACDQCPKKFKGKQALKNHVGLAHRQWPKIVAVYSQNLG